MAGEAARRIESPETGSHRAVVNGSFFQLHLSGALYWPAERMLVVADLHFEKGSSFARKGIMLPPYDTAATIAALSEVIRAYEPITVITLGDSFHDDGAASRLPDIYRSEIRRLQTGRDWVWIAGNHDPAPPAELGGDHVEQIACAGMVMRHEPEPGPAPGEICGHLHPAARIRVRGRTLRRRCFLTDGERLILPAFGAFTGGLNVCDPAFEPLITRPRMTAFLLGRERIYPISGAELRPD